MSHLGQDLRLAFRSLWKYRGVSLFICVSVALGIAGNATTFSIIGGLMLRPFPYPSSQELMVLWSVPKERPTDQGELSAADYLDFKAKARSFTAVEAFSEARFNLTGGDQPEEVRAVVSTPGGLAMLGYRPAFGRNFLAEEGLPGRDHVTLLSHEIWQRRFGGDPAIVGRTVELDDEAYTVVGVMPAGIEFLRVNTGVWVPLAIDPAHPSRTERSLYVMGRRLASVSVAAAKDETSRIGAELETAHPEANRGYLLRAATLREDIPGPTDRKLFTIMQSVMLLVLLIACANVANLLLARGQDRGREIALRTTLGAGRGRVVRQLLTESLLLATLGGALGLTLSYWAIETMKKVLAAQVPKAFLPELDLPVVLFGIGIAAFAGLLFGLYPALEASNPNLAGTLREGAKGLVSRHKRRVIKALVVAEIAFALGALSATGLLVRTMIMLQNLDAGFDSRNVLTQRLSLTAHRYPQADDAARFYIAASERLAALPGVEAVTAAAALPRSRNQPASAFTIDGAPPAEGQAPSENTLSVLPNYFAVMRIPLAGGRGFEATDRAGTAPVALVSQAWVKRYLPNQPAIGRHLTVGGVSREIVGVTADVVQNRIAGREGPTPMIYLPQAQSGERNLYLLLRTAAAPVALADPIRAAIGELDRTLPVAGLATLEQRIAEEFVGARLIATILASFGLIALLLAGLGIYGVIAYSVSQQTHEIGVRLAIGAQRSEVVAQIARQGLLLTAGGLVLGLPLVVLAVLGTKAALAGLPPNIYASLPWVAVALAVVAGLASFLPARRAALLDPVSALRQD